MMAKTKQSRDYPPDTRPTKPITIDGVEYVLHIKTVLGEAGEYDLWDMWELHQMLTTGTYNENTDKDVYRWRDFRECEQRIETYQKFKLAGFVHVGEDEPRIPYWSRYWINERGLRDFADWHLNREWEQLDHVAPPMRDSNLLSGMEPGKVQNGDMHSPTADKMRAQGHTEEAIFDQMLTAYYDGLPNQAVIATSQEMALKKLMDEANAPA